MLTCMLSIQAQSISPSVLSPSGAVTTFGGGKTISWTIGELPMTTTHVAGGWITNNFNQPSPAFAAIFPQVNLEGPFVSGTGLMNDNLRSLPSFPLTEPYSAMLYPMINSGGEHISPAVLSVTGNNAIVDWVYVQLRSAANNTQIVATRCALLQRDGDVVDLDGVNQLRFVAAPGNYYVAVFHRNHLPVLSSSTINLGPLGVFLNFRSATTGNYGTNAQNAIGGVRALWAGDVTGDGTIKYTGPSNDRDPILVKVGSTTPNNTVAGYWREDVNLTGQVKYAGPANDRDPILVNVGSTTPNNTRVRQLP
jgi:hypothetical protein